MGATIMYQPVKGIALKIGAASSFLEVLRREFGEGYWTFSDTDCHRLSILEVELDSLDQKAAIHEIAEMAMKYGEVRVWAEY